MNRLLYYFLLVWLICYIPLIITEILLLYFVSEQPLSSAYKLIGLPLLLIFMNFSIPIIIYNSWRKNFFLLEKGITEEELINIEDGTEIMLWDGRKSRDFIEKNLFKYFMILWYTSLFFLFLFKAIELGSHAVGEIHSLLTFIFIAFGNLIFIFLSYIKIKDIEVIYGITDKRVFCNLNDKLKEILLNTDIQFNIRINSIESHIGTVLFYHIPFEKPKLKFEYIKDINRVEEVLKGLISSKK